MTKEEIKREFITPLKLQKLLYYVQGLSLSYFGKPTFFEDIVNWSYGPVVKEVYKNYKENIRKPLEINDDSDVSLTNGVEYIIQIVIDSYGDFIAEKMIDFTHEEDPWKLTEKNEIISNENIKEYFKRIYNIWNIIFKKINLNLWEKCRKYYTFFYDLI